MGGIIMGAMGGAGEQLANIGSTMMKNDLELESRRTLQREDSDLAVQRAKTLEEFKATLGETQRQAQATRVNNQVGVIADAQVGKKRGVISSAIADPGSWTPEQQAAVDQSLAIDREGIVADPKTRTQAAIETGDISPKDAAVLTQKDEAAIYKAMWEQSKEDGRNARSDARISAQQEASDKRLAYLFAALEKKGAKGGEADVTKAALQFMEGSRKEVQSEAANLKALYTADLKDKSRAERAKIEADYAPKFAAIEEKRTQIEADYGSLRSKVGLPELARKAPAPTPAPTAAPAAAPASRASQFRVLR